VRAAQRGSWFPLLVFGIVTVAAIPFEGYGHFAHTCANYTAFEAASPRGRVCSVYSTSSFVYWPIALVVAYSAITAFYLRRSNRRGVGTRIQPYLITGIALAVVLTALSIWSAHNPAARIDILGLHEPSPSTISRVFHRLLNPASAIGLALLVLARVERSWALAGFSVAYLVLVLGGVDLGWTLTRPSPWSFLPHLVVSAGMLLAGSAGFALAERHGLDSATTRRPQPPQTGPRPPQTGPRPSQTGPQPPETGPRPSQTGPATLTDCIAAQ
jgi:hypothetical protein